MKVRGKKLLAAILSAAMLASLLTLPASAAGETATYTLLSSEQTTALADLTAGGTKIDANSPAWGEGKSVQMGTATDSGKYFTVHYSGKSKADGSAKTINGENLSSPRFNLGGKATTTANSIEFTTSNPATVNVWWVEGGDRTAASPDIREITILDSTGTAVVTSTEGASTDKNAAAYSSLSLPKAGTYFLGGDVNNNYIFKVEVIEKTSGTTPGGGDDPVDPPSGETIEARAYNFRGYDHTQGGANSETVTVTGLELTGLPRQTYQNENGHGLHGAANCSMTLHLPAGKQSDLTLTTCCYGNAEGNITVTGGTLDTTATTDTGEDNNGTKGKVYTITGAAGDVTITFGSEVYVHSLEVGTFTSTTGGDGPDPGPGTDTPSEWVFSGETFDENTTELKGLKLTGIAKNGIYALGGQNDKIQVPVTGKCDVTVEFCYAAEGTIGDVNFSTDSGSTSQLDTATYSYAGTGGYVDIVCTGANTYITKITISEYSGDKVKTDAELVAEGVSAVKAKLKLATVAQADVNTEAAAQAAVQAKVDTATLPEGVSATAAITAFTAAEGANNGSFTYKVTVSKNAASDETTTGTVTILSTDVGVLEEKDNSFTGKGDYYIKGVTWPSYVADNNGHGPMLSGHQSHEVVLHIPAGETANITVETCCYGAGTFQTMDSSSGTVASVQRDEGNSKAMKFIVTGATGDVTLTFSAAAGASSYDAYIHRILVEFQVVAENRKIDVWDFAGKVQAGDDYVNHITPADWVSSGSLNEGGKFNAGSTIFGDVTVTHIANDRLYSTITEPADFAKLLYSGNYSHTFGDGYETAGGYYCNGNGGDSRRHISVAHVVAGDKIVAYLGSTGSAPTTYHFQGQGGASAQDDTAVIASKSPDKVEFTAQHDGTYKIWAAADSDQAKPMYYRVVRYPGVAVSGAITFPSGFNAADYTVKFVNQKNNQETEATVADDGSFTATLAPGFTYTAVLSGASGWGFTAATKTVTTTDAEALTGKSGVALAVEAKATYTYSGSVTGFASGYDTSKLAITLTPAEGSNADPVKLTIDASLGFTATLEADVNYGFKLEGVNDYRIKAPASVTSTGANVAQDIEVELKPTYTVSGKFLGLPAGSTVTALNFEIENEDGNYTYPATVTADGYTAKLRDGAYAAVATVTGCATKAHVVVNGANVTDDLLFVAPADTSALTWAADVYVGYADKANNYATVNEAVKAVSRMGVNSEDKRVTIHIAPGTYREQVIIDTPYITLMNDEADQGKEVLLTWYYGIGYMYYSSNKGYYDAELAHDKYAKAIADRWGTTVRVNSSAKGFRAEGVTFENSFNRYVTEEEIADGVEPGGGSNNANLPARNHVSIDVQTKNATERATAICVEANQCEFYNCKFYSSQDTVYTNGQVYFKNCLIEGQTDYIFGDAASKCIFDACELSWKGYSAGAQGGYITALRSNANEVGYLFRNCAVTKGDLPVEAGYFGRPWGADANVKFVNTKLESAGLIVAAGWTAMSGNQPQNAQFGEFGTTALDGAAVDTSNRVVAVMSQTQADAIKMADYFGSWTPYYYVAEAEGAVEFTTAPSILSNGDILVPYPGNTFTVNYSLGDHDANDASIIQWYRVKDGVKTLVKSSTAAAEKTYKVVKGDVGATIEVTVTPTTVSGKTGTAATATSLTINDGYQDPDDPAADPELGAGVNVFLAGDSTVKDYSAKGMWNSGKSENLGSWGEFLQSYFNDKVTVVNYANGGRSSSNFINEGSLAKIAANIKEGDFLLIQFGHNDCSTDDRYREGRYVPLGAPDAGGSYPYEEGVKNSSGKYDWTQNGTYKWFLMEYVKVAREAGATPILVTPVSRMYYKNGTIRPHHDNDHIIPNNTKDMTQWTSMPDDQKTNAYVTAVRQVAQEKNVLLIDGFDLTKTMFEDAYKAAGNDTYGAQAMGVGDKTHSNKLGGMIEAGLIAQTIQGMDLSISKAVKAPAQVLGQTTKSETVFSVDADSKLQAFDQKDFTTHATYWEGVGQQLFDAIAANAGGSPEPKLDAVAGGWFETIFAEIKGVSDADVTAVSWSGAATGSLTGDALTYLVRDMTGGVRIDIPGLKAGTYDLKLTVKGSNYTFKGIKVDAYDRSGFAHYNYTEGVGAYNDDGTLKDNAVVLYVTDGNKDTVSLTVKDGSKDITVAGIGNILNSKGWRLNHNGQKPLQKMASAGRPLVVRIIGRVTKPEGVTGWNSTVNGGSEGDNGGMCIMEYAKDITIEGIGMDATVDGWGFAFNASGTGMGAAKTGGKNFEVRNVTFRNVPEDCIGIQGELKNGEFDSPAEHIWVHNNAFYGPHDLPDASTDKDKAEGDGAVDFVNSQYMTMSYNYFEDYHKTSLIGSSKSTLQYHVTWHHNHWKDVQSRSPLVRKANVHIYNNFYDGQTSYCMSLRGDSYVFSEYNAFENCNNPVVNENDPAKGDKDGLGGVCKSCQDVFANTCKGTNDATIVTDKTQTVTSPNKYADFDTDPDSYIAKGAYKLDTTVAAAKENIQLYGGVMKMPKTLVRPDGSTTPVEPTPTVTVTGVSLSITELELTVGEATDPLTATVTVTPDTTENKAVTWTSSNPSVVTVSADGVVTAKATGTATITAKSVKDPSKKAICTVKVEAGGSGGSATPETHTFESKNLTAFAAGAKSDGETETVGGYFTIIYSAKSKVDESNKSWEDDGYTSAQRLNLGGKLDPAKNSVKFTTTNPATVKIWWVQGGEDSRQMGIMDASKNVVVKTEGTYTKNSPYFSTLTLSAAGEYYLGGVENNNNIYKIEVTETPSGGSDTPAVPITGVSLDKTTLSLAEGGSATLKATIAPENATTNKTLTWTSSDDTVATVDDTGKVTAVKAGTATVTVTTKNGKKATCAVTVTTTSGGGSSGDMVPTTSGGSGGKTETVTNPDGSKTTTKTDRKGNTTVTTVATDGSKVESVTNKAGDKTVTVTDAKGNVQVKLELPAVIPAPETKFTDVPEGHWAEKAVNDMAGLGTVKGVSEGVFDMTSPITRASVATILFRLSNGAEGKTSSFTDVASDDWFADAVAWAADTGVVTGFSETVFGPNESITREQFAVMLYRFAKLIGMDTTAAGDVSKFSDAASVAQWAGEAMSWCVGKGVLNGTSDPVQGITLSPAKTASRAECAVMLSRFIDLI